MEHADKKPLQVLKESCRVVHKDSAAKQLHEVTLFLDPKKNKAVKEFHDKMPDTVKALDSWKREAANITVATSQLGDFLTMEFEGLMADPPEFTEEEVYEDFISTKTNDEIKKLESESAHFKVIDAVTLARDAGQDLLWWQQLANNDTTLRDIAITSWAGVGGMLAALTLANPVGATVVGVSALSAITLRFWLGWDRSTNTGEGSARDLMDRALLVSDICESIRRDVRLLDEIGVHASNIAKCQEKVQKARLVNRLQRQKIIISARKMKEACDRYIKKGD